MGLTWWGGVGGGDTFWSVIESQSSGEPVALHCEPQKYFQLIFLPLLGGEYG